MNAMMRIGPEHVAQTSTSTAKTRRSSDAQSSLRRLVGASGEPGSSASTGTLRDANEREVVVRESRVREPVQGADAKAAVAAMSGAILKIVDEIAGEIRRAQQGPSPAANAGGGSGAN